MESRRAQDSRIKQQTNETEKKETKNPPDNSEATTKLYNQIQITREVVKYTRQRLHPFFPFFFLSSFFNAIALCRSVVWRHAVILHKFMTANQVLFDEFSLCVRRANVAYRITEKNRERDS